MKNENNIGKDRLIARKITCQFCRTQKKQFNIMCQGCFNSNADMAEINMLLKNKISELKDEIKEKERQMYFLREELGCLK